MNVTFPILLISVAAANPVSPRCPYPHELPGYALCRTAKWSSLTPLESSISDVLRVLGEPLEASDLANYTAPYPGHRKAKEPVFTYDGGPDWEVLIYFVKTDAWARSRLPESLGDLLLSVDLIPRKRLPFLSVVFPAVFVKSHVIAADAAWDEYTDGSGLRYLVYTARTQFGDQVRGDLNRISYGPSDEAMKRRESQ